MPTVNDIFVYLFCAIPVLLALGGIILAVLRVQEVAIEYDDAVHSPWARKWKSRIDQGSARISRTTIVLAFLGIVLFAGWLVRWHFVAGETPPSIEEHLAIGGIALGMLLCLPLLFSWLRLIIHSLPDSRERESNLHSGSALRSDD